MQLYLTSYDPSNSNYCSQGGKIAYKVACTPSGMRRAQTVTIWRALPSLEVTPEATLWAEKHFGTNENRLSRSYDYSQNEMDEPRVSITSQDEQLASWTGPPTVDHYKILSAEAEKNVGLTKIAEIELHTISSTIIRHLGNEWKASEFFRKEGWSWYGSDRIFKDLDGKEYKWKMGSRVCELFLLDGDPKEEHGKAHVPVLVARFHTLANQPDAPPLLEIFPAGEDMVDWILITFVYIELLRNGRRLGTSRTRTATEMQDGGLSSTSSDTRRLVVV